jgi:hypothetical protein
VRHFDHSKAHSSSLDSTYSLSRFGYKLFTILGVNNHLNTVHFAHALLINEDSESFQWVWQTLFRWAGTDNGLRCIQCALMDGSQAMFNGIHAVCPTVIVDRSVANIPASAFSLIISVALSQVFLAYYAKHYCED